MGEDALTRRDPKECSRLGVIDLLGRRQTSVDVVLQRVLQGTSETYNYFKIKMVGSEGIEPPTNSV